MNRSLLIALLVACAIAGFAIAEAWGKSSTSTMDQRDWPAAIKVDNLSLESFPDNSLFRQNIKYCEQKLQAK